MIAFLSGTIEYLAGDTAVIDVGGVGYEVNISADTAAGLSAVGTGNAVKLYTYTYMRDGQAALYGFLSRDDLAILDLLVDTVCSTAQTIARAPGVGKKTAERLILDLRDKISSAYAPEEELPGAGLSGASPGSGDVKSGTGSSAGEDAVEALTALGYMRAEAVRAVKQCNEKEDVEKILREALRYLL